MCKLVLALFLGFSACMSMDNHEYKDPKLLTITERIDLLRGRYKGEVLPLEAQEQCCSPKDILRKNQINEAKNLQKALDFDKKRLMQKYARAWLHKNN